MSEAPKPIFSFGQNLASKQPTTDVLQPTIVNRPSNESAKLWKLITPVAPTSANQTVDSKFFAFAEKSK